MACSDGGAQVGVPSATVATAPATTTTTDPYAVPAVIDAAYVDRVLQGLDKAYGETTRLIVSSRALVPIATGQLRALFGSNSALQSEFTRFQLEERTQFDGYKGPPGDQKTTVEQVITGTPTCIFLRARRDYSAVYGIPGPSHLTWIELRPLDLSRDPDRYNPTRWAFHYNGFPQPGSPDPPNPCI